MTGIFIDCEKISDAILSSGWVPACDMSDLRVPCLSMVLRSYVHVVEDTNFLLLQRKGEWVVAKMMPKVKEFP
jgi:hypothetical protein